MRVTVIALTPFSCPGIIVVITVQAVVGIRQQYQRKVTGLPPPPPGVLFPNVTRAVADDGVVECLKFLLNYGFYKFGVEVWLPEPGLVMLPSVYIMSICFMRLDVCVYSLRF